MLFKMSKTDGIEGDDWRLWLSPYGKDVAQVQVANERTGEAHTFTLGADAQAGSSHKVGARIINRLATIEGEPRERLATLKRGLASLQGALPEAIDVTKAAHLKGRYGDEQADVFLVAPEDSKGLTIRISLPDGRSFSIEIEARGAGAGQALLVMLLRRLVSKIAPVLAGGALRVDDLVEVIEDGDA